MSRFLLIAVSALSLAASAAQAENGVTGPNTPASISDPAAAPADIGQVGGRESSPYYGVARGETSNSGDIFLRSAPPEQGAQPAEFLRGGPIDLSGGYGAKAEDNELNALAVAKVYTQEPATLPADKDYSAGNYNETQTQAINMRTVQMGNQGVADPFPSWFGNYAPPKLEDVKRAVAVNGRTAEPKKTK